MYIGSWQYEAYDALRDALEDPSACGNPVEMAGADDSYEFFIFYGSKKLYAKVGLLNEAVSIVIFSTHPPKRDYL